MPVPIDAGFRLINGMAGGLLLANYSFSQKAIPLNGDSPTSATLQKAARPVTATEHTHPFAIDPAVFADTRSGNGRTVADHAVLRHWQAANRGRSDRSIRRCGPVIPRAALRRSDRQQ